MSTTNDAITAPGRSSEIREVIDLTELQSIQDRLAQVANVSMIVVDLDGNSLTHPSNFNPVCKLIWETDEGRKLCDQSDRDRNDLARRRPEPLLRCCSCCGFVDASVPIVVDGVHLANWLTGQVNAAEVSREQIEVFAGRIEADTDRVLAAFDRLPRVSMEQLQKVMGLVQDVVDEITSLTYENRSLRDKIASDRKPVQSTDGEEARLEQLLSTCPTVLLRGISSSRFPLTFVSDSVITMLGYVPARFYDDGDFWQNLVRPEDLERVMRARNDLSGGKQVNVEYEMKAMHGRTVSVLEQLTPLFNSESGLYEYVGNWTETTDRSR